MVSPGLSDLFLLHRDEKLHFIWEKDWLSYVWDERVRTEEMSFPHSVIGNPTPYYITY